MAHDASPHLHRTLPSTYEALEDIVNETSAFVEEHLDEETGYNVMLLVSEAVTNAIEHGNQMEACKQVHVDVRVLTDRIEVSVEDEGVGFNRDQVDHPLDDENLLEDSGRGLFLLETLAREVHYEEHGRRIRFVLDHPSQT